jgi:hypothetical protein
MRGSFCTATCEEVGSCETDTFFYVNSGADNLPRSVWICEKGGEGDKILPLTGALEIEGACWE